MLVRRRKAALRRLREASSCLHMIGMNVEALEPHVQFRDAQAQGLDTLDVCVLVAFEHLYFSDALAPLSAIAFWDVLAHHCGAGDGKSQRADCHNVVLHR